MDALKRAIARLVLDWVLGHDGEMTLADRTYNITTDDVGPLMVGIKVRPAGGGAPRYFEVKVTEKF